MGQATSVNQPKSSANQHVAKNEKGCPLGTHCVGKYCEWNHDAATKNLKKECPTDCGLCEIKHDAVTK
jgi:hypothetical protein